MAKLNHVQGNFMSLCIPLVVRTRTVIDGNETYTDTPYTPSPSESVSVRLIRKEKRAFSFVPTVEESTAIINDDGKLPLGVYDVEVLISGGSHPMRFCDVEVLEIHNSTKAAGITPGQTLSATTYTLEGAVFFNMATGGSSFEQVQSDWEETDESSTAFIQHKPEIPSLEGYATQQYVISAINAHIVDGSNPSDPHKQTMSAYAIHAEFAKKGDLDGLASQQWVQNQGYLTQHQSLFGYATEQWVSEQGYLTQHQSLEGYATQQWVGNQGFLTQHQDISGKENRMPIVVPNSLSFAAETGKYYRITQSGAITVTLPIVQSDYIENIILFFTAASDDCLDFISQDSVIFADGYEINAGDICEVNAVFNGGGWQVTVVKFS